MVDSIEHRGPDDAGYLFFHTGCRHEKNVSFYLNLTDDKFKHHSDLMPSIDSRNIKHELNLHDWDVYLGHRRLSIIDTSFNGHQPMSDLAKNIWVVYNGEIYNFKEIKKKLRKLGYFFKTNSDTEVIIYAYLAWGIDAIKYFNGMFAFALYDNNKKKIYLVRDRYGIKPIYYTIMPNKTILFASEIKAILQYKECPSSLDLEVLPEYFTFQNIFTDKTFHKNIQLLSPGFFVEIDLNSKNFVKKQYWDFCFKKTSVVKDENQYVEELDRLFTQAVRRQLVSDVEVGSFLSGGMDSGSITSVAARDLPYMNTFTVGFDLNSISGIELGFDERATAEYMSYLFKTEHYEMVLKSGDMERCLVDFSYHLEEPRVGQSYPNYYASKLASKFVKVCLAGTGGDELFAGYPWRYYRTIENKNFDEYIAKYYSFWQRLISEKELECFFSPIWNKIQNVNTKNIFKNVFKHHAQFLNQPEDFINHSLYFEFKTFLHGLLVVEDKLSMAHSLETRVPFLDNDLVDFAMSLPVNMKLSRLLPVQMINENNVGNKKEEYFRKTNDGKLILRKMMKKHIPNKIALAKKQGFSSPDASWFKGDSVEFVRNILLDKNNEIYNYINFDVASKRILDHFSSKNNNRLFIWSLLNFNQWIKQNG